MLNSGFNLCNDFALLLSHRALSLPKFLCQFVQFKVTRASRAPDLESVMLQLNSISCLPANKQVLDQAQLCQCSATLFNKPAAVVLKQV